MIEGVDKVDLRRGGIGIRQHGGARNGVDGDPLLGGRDAKGEERGAVAGLTDRSGGGSAGDGVVDSGLGVAKSLASMTVMPENVPLKLVFLVETPLMRMVPGFAGLMLCAAVVVMVTTLEARVALAIPTDADFW